MRKEVNAAPCKMLTESLMSPDIDEFQKAATKGAAASRFLRVIVTTDLPSADLGSTQPFIFKSKECSSSSSAGARSWRKAWRSSSERFCSAPPDPWQTGHP